MYSRIIIRCSVDEMRELLHDGVGGRGESVGDVAKEFDVGAHVLVLLDCIGGEVDQLG